MLLVEHNENDDYIGSMNEGQIKVIIEQLNTSVKINTLQSQGHCCGTSMGTLDSLDTAIIPTTYITL